MYSIQGNGATVDRKHWNVFQLIIKSHVQIPTDTLELS